MPKLPPNPLTASRPTSSHAQRLHLQRRLQQRRHLSLSDLKTPTYQNTGSTARDHLASERTFLAWLRTGLGFVALGLAVERFGRLDLNGLVKALEGGPAGPGPATSSAESRVAGGTGEAGESSKNPAKDSSKTQGKAEEGPLVATLLGTGAGTVVYGTARYFGTMRTLQKGAFRPAWGGAVGIAAAVAACGGLGVWGGGRG